MECCAVLGDEDGVDEGKGRGKKELKWWWVHRFGGKIKTRREGIPEIGLDATKIPKIQTKPPNQKMRLALPGPGRTNKG